jgi:hypothetical protein
MILEDNNGFVKFPPINIFNRISGKTIIYLVAFDSCDINGKYILSNIKLDIPGEFITDDISGEYLNNDDEEEGGYYPRDNSLNLTSCICIGWKENIYTNRENKKSWYASFKDLSNEGRKLYYSMKKLHNNKEIRILTFNLI